ncbi:cyclically-permuted mutarotase family protein [Proteiniphilum sp. X52]|nr:cyclically-permuted mutarotase family protein [Proteiniphilum sp. X52]
MKINWTPLPVEGLGGNLQKGVSAAYAALIDGNLVVAGGANFPGKPGFEGGSKTFYDEIMLFDSSGNSWKIAGHLPRLSAYGVSVPVSDGALWIGGNTAAESLASCYKVSLSERKHVELKPFTPLPATMDNLAGCAIDDMVFVGGGNVNGKPSNAFYCIHAKNDSAWRALPDFPGIPRVQPVMAAMEKDGKHYVYLLGGFFGGNADSKPAMATDVLRYDVAARSWETVGEQIDAETGKPFSLGGATAMPLDNGYILCLGGVNYNIFLDAITRQYAIGNDTHTSAEEKSRLYLEFSKNYMTQPVEYYRFNPECRIYDIRTNRWETIDVTPNAARAGATLVSDGNIFYAVQGELKPGVRSSETWKGEIQQIDLP